MSLLPDEYTHETDGLHNQLLGWGAREPQAGALVQELVERHIEPHRSYHSLEHVGEVLTEVRRLAPHVPEADQEVVELAAWFHDAVYEPTRSAGHSETDSAALAVSRLADLRLDAGADLVEEVARLVLITAGHHPNAGDANGQLLVDADLWVLASEHQRYDRYVEGVRAEYGHLPESAWSAGRAQVLHRFLEETDRLYTVGPLDDRRRRRELAQANLNRELAFLEA